jgi:hypothetical protein
LLLGTNLSAYWGLPSPATKIYTKDFVTRLHRFTNLQGLSEQAGKVFWALRNLSALLEAILAGKESADSPNPNDIQFSDRVEMLERSVLPLWHASGNEGYHFTIFRLFGWASLIYIYSEFRHVPCGMLIFQRLAERIRIDIGKCLDLNELFGTFPDLMLWILQIASLKASQSQKFFFRNQASKILQILRIQGERDSGFEALTFLWPEKREHMTIVPTL